MSFKITPHRHGAQVFPRRAGRGWKGQDALLPVITPLFRAGLGLLQRKIDFLPSLNFLTTPDQVAHGHIRRDPGAAGHRPSGTVLHGKIEPEPLGFPADVGNQPVPIGAQGLNLWRNARPGTSTIVEKLNTTKTGISYCFQVHTQPVSTDLPSDEVKPGFGMVLNGWLPEFRYLLRVAGGVLGRLGIAGITDQQRNQEKEPSVKSHLL